MRPSKLHSVFGWGLAVYLLGPMASSAAGPIRKIKILASVFPLAEFARAITGERGDVGLVLPPGAEVHTWQPRISDIKKIADADLFLYVGRGLEPWVGDLLRSSSRPGAKNLELGRDIRMIPSTGAHGGNGAEGPDPHIWLDFEVDRTLVVRIAEAVSEIEPSAAGEFSRAAAAFEERLRRLDDEYRAALGTCPIRAFLFSGHAAFGYLARRYGLEQISIFGRSPDSAPTPRELAAVADRAKSLGITCVFVEPGVGEKLAKVVASAIGADIRPLNPGHNLTAAELAAGATFLGLMKANLENFKHGLACR